MGCVNNDTEPLTRNLKIQSSPANVGIGVESIVQVVRRDDGAELGPVPGRGAAPLAVQARLDAHAQGPPQGGLRDLQVRIRRVNKHVLPVLPLNRCCSVTNVG